VEGEAALGLDHLSLARHPKLGILKQGDAVLKSGKHLAARARPLLSISRRLFGKDDLSHPVLNLLHPRHVCSPRLSMRRWCQDADEASRESLIIATQ
jgi:hypothetical protein